MENKIIYDTSLGLVDYFAMVEEIVSEYFNEEGNYQPHVGRLNAMRLFYNHCVKDGKFEGEIAHDIVDALDMEPLVKDVDFVMAFTEATSNIKANELSFGNAYNDSLAIVKVKKSAFERIADGFLKSLSSLVDKAAPFLNEDVLAKVSDIAKDIGNGKISAQSIVDAYANSERLKEVVSQQDGDAKNKVILRDHLTKNKV